VVGKIDKKELDDERKNETNALDYMQNTSIVYHTESILESQIISLLLCYILTNNWGETALQYGTKSNMVSDSAVINFGLT
jgi:hypothetical protein